MLGGCTNPGQDGGLAGDARRRTGTGHARLDPQRLAFAGSGDSPRERSQSCRNHSRNLLPTSLKANETRGLSVTSEGSVHTKQQ